MADDKIASPNSGTDYGAIPMPDSQVPTSGVDYGQIPQAPHIEQMKPMPPLQAISGFSNNARKGVENLVTGIGVLGSAGAMKFAKTATPPMIWESDLLEKLLQKPNAENAFNAFVPEGPFNPKVDIPQAVQTGKAVVNDYAKRYEPIVKAATSQPFLSGNVPLLTPQVVQEMGQNFYKDPVSYTMDAMPLLGKVKMAGGAAVREAPSLIKPIINQAEKQVAEKAGWSVVEEMSNELIRKLLPYEHHLDDAWRAIPNEVKPFVVEAGEWRLGKLVINYKGKPNTVVAEIPEVRHFLDTFNFLDDGLATRLIQAGAFDLEKYLMAKYGPAASHYFPHQEITPELIEQTREILHQQGHEATYFPIAFKSQVKRALNLRSGLVLNEKAKAPIDEQWRMGRTANGGAGNRYKPGISKNAGELAKATMYWGETFLSLHDLFKKLLENPTIAGNVEVDISQSINALAQEAGVSPQATANLVESIAPGTGGKIFVSEEMASILNRAMAPKGWWDKTTEFTKGLLLGLNPGYPFAQGIQNQGIAAYAMFQGPQDTAASVMAYRFLNDKQFERELQFAKPDLHGEIRLQEYFDHVDSHMEKLSNLMEKMGVNFDPKIAKPLASIMASITWYQERVFGMATKLDNVSRNLMAAHSLMQQADLTPDLKVAMSKALDLQARQLQMREVMNRPDMVRKMAEDNLKWLGDYRPANRQKHQLLVRTTMWGMWWLHALSIFKALPESPFKLAALAEWAKVAPESYQPPELRGTMAGKAGAVPYKNREGVWKSWDNMKLIKYGAGFSPITQIPEIVGQVINNVSGEGGSLPAFNLLIAFLGDTVYRVNPSTGGNFSNPYLVGKTHRFDVRQGLDENGLPHQVSDRPGIPIQNIPLRLIYQPGEQMLREWIAEMAGGFKPTDQTTIGDVAAKPGKVPGTFAKQVPPFQLLMQQIFHNRLSTLNKTKAEEDLANVWKLKEYIKSLKRYTPQP